MGITHTTFLHFLIGEHCLYHLLKTLYLIQSLHKNKRNNYI